MTGRLSPLEVLPTYVPEQRQPLVGDMPVSSVFSPRVVELLTCFIGLQLSYLTWGFCQESLMTTQFGPTPLVPEGRFPSAAFAVFSNRVVAIIVACVAVKNRHGTLFDPKSAPILSFAPCALSNTFSSWSQYNALKFVTFPVQTIFKSSKIIPVMLMGRFLKGTMYGPKDYFEAILITLGVFIFSYNSKKHSGDQTDSEAIGIVFLTCYICCDAFTSNWQSKIYQRYGKANVDSFQMMFGVNSFAIFFTSLGLLTSGELPVIIEFLTHNPVAFWYNFVTSITSATGQLFIFRTIKEFGPVTFSLIMTTRQIFSIILSSMYFQHAMSLKSMCGATLVFSVIGHQLKRKFLAGKLRAASK
ncbi:hypothetical protein TrRE_jg12950 [Triparma retinervis]|uniref:Uncharacterized protein n=1 Tax=Triparma retinervis TaxID=2557542 RepID=A0A9W6ZYZ5_9STRA|nr:hypothetical protein TrRE_jg12950 [Triparma retinervis]